MTPITPTLVWVVDSSDPTPSFIVGLGGVGDVVTYTTMRLRYSPDGVSNWTDYTAILLMVDQLTTGSVTVTVTGLSPGVHFFQARLELLVAAGSPWTTDEFGGWSNTETVILVGGNIVVGAPNTQSQFGFRHVGYISSGTQDYQLNVRSIQSSYATAIYYGDPVIKISATPYIAPALNNQTTIIGIFQGCSYWPKVGTMPVFSRFWPGGPQRMDATAYIVDAPTAIFVGASLLTSVLPYAIGQNIGFALGSAPSTTGPGYSTYVLDQATLTTDPASPFQVYSMYDGAGNGSDLASNYNWIVVTFNNERFKAQTGNA